MPTVATDAANTMTKQETFTQAVFVQYLAQGKTPAEAAVLAVDAVIQLVLALNGDEAQREMVVNSIGFTRQKNVQDVMRLYGWPAGLGPIEMADDVLLAKIANSQRFYESSGQSGQWAWSS